MSIFLIQRAQIISNQCEAETIKQHKQQDNSDFEILPKGFYGLKWSQGNVHTGEATAFN